MVTKLLERQSQLEELVDAAESASRGEGRVVIVAGEAGIGKSALVAAFVEGLDASVQVLRGACDDLLAPRPLAPFREMARGRQGPLVTALAAANPTEAAFPAVIAEVSSHPSSVLVVEDVQWADDATLDLLTVLAQQIDHLPAILILTFRPEDGEANQALRRLLGALAGPWCVRLRLEPLSTRAVAGLAEAMGRDSADLHALTGGNPFFLTETLASPPGVLPVTAADAVLVRMRQLGPDTVAAIEQLSVVPGTVELTVVDALLADWKSVLTPAEERGILNLQKDGLTFRHELARRAVEASLLQLRRRSFNLSVVHVLRQMPEVDIERIVHHAVQANDAATIADVAPRAAQRAAAEGAHRQALAHFEAAVQHVDLLTADQQAMLVDGYGWELHQADRVAEAIVAGRDAVARYEALADPIGLSNALRRLSRHVLAAGDPDEAEQLLERAAGAVEGSVQIPERSAAATDRAALLVLTARPAEALPVIQVAQQLARQAGRPDLESLCLNYLGLARAMLHDDGEPALRAALTMAKNHGSHESAARAYVNLVDILLGTGRWADLGSTIDAGISHAREHGLWKHASLMEAQRYALLAHHGDWDGAERGWRTLSEQDVSTGAYNLQALPGYARLLVRRGRIGAVDVLERAWQHALSRRAPVALQGIALVEWSWLVDRPGRARQLADVLLPRLQDAGWAYMRGELLRYLALAGIPVTPFNDCPEPWAAALHGDWQAAAQAWERRDVPYERALALADSGQAEPTLEGLQILDALGAAATAHVRQRLRDLGVRPPPQPRPRRRQHPLGLTAREIDVFDFVAQGATNAEIAAKLMLSVSTVNHHVSAVLAKVGVGSRKEAVAVLRGLPAAVERTGK